MPRSSSRRWKAAEAATADLNDVNMIDPFHLAAYGETTVNYNRDVEVFPVLSNIFETIMGESPYKSPTDMGVNMIGILGHGQGLTDDRTDVGSDAGLLHKKLQLVDGFVPAPALTPLGEGVVVPAEDRASGQSEPPPPHR